MKYRANEPLTILRHVMSDGRIVFAIPQDDILAIRLANQRNREGRVAAIDGDSDLHVLVLECLELYDQLRD
ncbi:hypothetical protein [Xanthomonas sp. SHU 166]|nr:hypothetical protein [Xanthomonas sp. SHU 166]